MSGWVVGAGFGGGVLGARRLAEAARQNGAGSEPRTDNAGGERRRAHRDPLAFFFGDAREGGGWRQGQHVGERVNGLGEADALLGAAEARVTGTDRPRSRTGVVEQNGGAVGVRFRSFAAQLVKAPSLAMAGV